MGAKKNRTYSEDTIFDELTQTIEQEPEPVDLQSKEIQFEAKRHSKRASFHGTVTLFNLRDKVITKASIRDLSPGGLSFEILPIDVKAEQDVYVQFSFALGLGMILCTVQWVANIRGHRNNHKMIGLKFKRPTPLMLKQLNEFLAKLQNKREDDPFYVG